MPSFLPTERAERIVPGAGPPDARIAIVGEAPGTYENAQLKPFVGPAGGVLEQCLHSAGLIRSEVYVTNVVKVHPPGNNIAPFFNAATGAFTPAGMRWVEVLRGELNELKPNIIVAAGATSLAALTCVGTSGQHRIMKYRGYLTESRGLTPERKVLPTPHPAAALRGQFTLRHLIAADLRKAREESSSPELLRPQRQLVYDFGTVTEALEWLDYYEHQPFVCFDIEVLNHEIACIGLSSSPDIACSFPLAGNWTELEEVQLWRALQRVLGNPASVKVAQNAIFDIHFLLTRCGLVVRGPIRDTMIAHSILYPELPKGLAFLGSIYCGSQTYWKDAIKFDNIKSES